MGGSFKVRRAWSDWERRPVWLEWSEGGGEREEGKAGRRQSRLFRGLWVTGGLGTLTPGRQEPWRAVGREGD